MNHDNERKAFDIWHLKQFKDINDDLNDDEVEHLYQRVYSHEAQDLIRQMEFNAWLSSANREGYKLVPLEPTERMLDSAYSSISDNLHYADLENIYTAMIGVCDDH